MPDNSSDASEKEYPAGSDGDRLKQMERILAKMYAEASATGGKAQAKATKVPTSAAEAGGLASEFADKAPEERLATTKRAEVVDDAAMFGKAVLNAAGATGAPWAVLATDPNVSKAWGELTHDGRQAVSNLKTMSKGADMASSHAAFDAQEAWTGIEDKKLARTLSDNAWDRSDAAARKASQLGEEAKRAAASHDDTMGVLRSKAPNAALKAGAASTAATAIPELAMLNYDEIQKPEAQLQWMATTALRRPLVASDLSEEAMSWLMDNPEESYKLGTMGVLDESLRKQVRPALGKK